MKQLTFTESQLAALLTAEYQRGYSRGIVIGRSGAVLEQVAHEREQDVRDAKDAAATDFNPHWLREPFTD